jgi:putative nucleotidyltransferase with HDIG domain
MNSDTILKKLDSIQSIPTLPAIAMEVNTMLQNRDTSVQQLKQTIEKDQAIVPKILKLVNSSFFGLQSKISNIDHAIVLLGFNPIRNAIVSVSIIEAFANKNTLNNFDITEFWTHSVAVAVLSKYLAVQTDYRSLEDAFTGGLLHDIGKLVMLQFLQDLFETVWTSARKNNLSFYRAEKKELPTTHTHIGAYLAGKWKLPATLTDAIRYHHSVRQGVNDLDLLLIVHAANAIANCFMVQSKNKLDLSEIHPVAVTAMNDTLKSVSEWFPGQLEEIQMACQFFMKC